MAQGQDPFDAFLDKAVAELQAKQPELVKASGFGDAVGETYSDESGRLHLLDAAGRVFLEADVVEIAAYNAEARAWLWSWAKGDVAPAARARSAVLKDLATTTGVEAFAAERALRLPDEAMAWRLVAAAVQRLGAVGTYRLATPDGKQMAFLAVMSVRDLRGAGGYGWSSRA